MRPNISEIIIRFMNEDAYKKMKMSELLRIFASSKAEKKSLEKILQDLENSGVIIADSKGKYRLSEKSGYMKGIIRINAKGFGFISAPGLESDIYVSKENLDSAMNNDEVLFKIIKHINQREKNG